MKITQDDWHTPKVIRADIPEHQYLINFKDDEMAVAFDEWWWGEGFNTFQKYCKGKEFI